MQLLSLKDKATRTEGTIEVYGCELRTKASSVPYQLMSVPTVLKWSGNVILDACKTSADSLTVY